MEKAGEDALAARVPVLDTDQHRAERVLISIALSVVLTLLVNLLYYLLSSPVSRSLESKFSLPGTYPAASLAA